MEWTQFSIFFIGVFGLFIWNRTEARADIRNMDNKLEATRELVYAMDNRLEATRELVHAIHNEMKDFHNRLCAIEERNKK